MNDNAIITEHQLDFEAAPWNNPANDEGWLLFRVGTVNGQWRPGLDKIEILSIVNDVPGNFHLNDLFEWFEFACKKYKVPLLIREVMNARFKKHLIGKRGFIEHGTDDVIKYFKNDHQ